MNFSCILNHRYYD